MNKRFRIISSVVLIAVVLLAVIAVTRLALQGPTVPKKNLSTSITPGMPYVQGSQIYDGSRHPLILRGAMIESSFAYLHLMKGGGVQKQQRVPAHLPEMKISKRGAMIESSFAYLHL